MRFDRCLTLKCIFFVNFFMYGYCKKNICDRTRTDIHDEERLKWTHFRWKTVFI